MPAKICLERDVFLFPGLSVVFAAQKRGSVGANDQNITGPGIYNCITAAARIHLFLLRPGSAFVLAAPKQCAAFGKRQNRAVFSYYNLWPSHIAEKVFGKKILLREKNWTAGQNRQCQHYCLYMTSGNFHFRAWYHGASGRPSPPTFGALPFFALRATKGRASYEGQEASKGKAGLEGVRGEEGGGNRGLLIF